MVGRGEVSFFFLCFRESFDIIVVIKNLIRSLTFSWQKSLNKIMRYFIGGIEKTKKEVQEWKKTLKKERQEGEKAAKMTQKFVNEQWPNKDEWYKMQDKLNQLSLKELRELTTKLGINFSIGNENINNKQDFILVLDEAVKKNLLKEYNKIIKQKGGEK